MAIRPFTKVRRKKGTREDPYHVIPIPPKSVVQISRADHLTPGWKDEIGKVFRIGYYSRMDGLDCVWLVDEVGEYEQTTDHEALFEYFDIIMVSDETDLYGVNRPKLPAIRKATGPPCPSRKKRRKD
jgi:hypothetical protein